MRLKNKVALITGGGSGIGEAVGHGFAAEGATVVIAEIDTPRGLAVEAAIKEQGGSARFIETDMASTDSVDAAVNSAAGEFGHIDILFNNAAVQLHGQPDR